MHNWSKDLMSTTPGQAARASGIVHNAPQMSPAAQAKGTAAPMGATVRAVNNGLLTSNKPLSRVDKPEQQQPQNSGNVIGSMAFQNNPFNKLSLSKLAQPMPPGQPPPIKQVMPAVPGSKPPISPTGQVPRGDGTDGPVINDQSVPPLSQFGIKPSPTTPQPMSPNQQGAFMPQPSPFLPPKVATDLVSAAIVCRMIKLAEQIEKKSFVSAAVPTLVGAGIGYGKSPKGKKTENTLYGAARGLGTGIGAALGGAGAHTLNHRLGIENPWAYLAMLGGGTVAGGLGGNLLSKALLEKFTDKNEINDRRYEPDE